MMYICTSVQCRVRETACSIVAPGKENKTKRENIRTRCIKRKQSGMEGLKEIQSPQHDGKGWPQSIAYDLGGLGGDILEPDEEDGNIISGMMRKRIFQELGTCGLSVPDFSDQVDSNLIIGDVP